MRRLIGLVLAAALAAPALSLESAHARFQGNYYICVNDCRTECGAYCYFWTCEDLLDGCQETGAVACHCRSF